MSIRKWCLAVFVVINPLRLPAAVDLALLRIRVTEALLSNRNDNGVVEEVAKVPTSKALLMPVYRETMNLFQSLAHLKGAVSALKSEEVQRKVSGLKKDDLLRLEEARKRDLSLATNPFQKTLRLLQQQSSGVPRPVAKKQLKIRHGLVR